MKQLKLFEDDSTEEKQDTQEENNAFDWAKEFPKCWDENGNFEGFDVVIGNPPYMAEKNKTVIEQFEKHYPQFTSYTKNSAMYFIFLADQITKKDGFHSMIIPKSFCYSHGWNSSVKFLIDNLLLLTDVGKAFPKVLLEQVIYLADKNEKTTKYRAGLYADNEFNTLEIDKKIFADYRLMLAGLTIKELKLLQKVLKESSHTYSDFVEISRGLNWQSLASKNKKLTPVYRGKQLNKYYLEPATDFINIQKFDKKVYEYQFRPKILNQLAIAHVKNPYPHFYLQASIDFDNKLVFETISCTFAKTEQLDLKFLLGFNNSKLFAWLLYKFVYSNAIRSTRFDEQYIGKIPCRNLTKINQKPIIKLVDKILKQKEKDPESDTSKIEKQIDNEVYKLYGLSEEEIKVVENEATETI